MTRSTTLILASLLVLILALSASVPDYRLEIITIALTLGLFTAAVDLAWGFCGILNFGPALSFGIGGYSVAIALRDGWSPVFGILLGIGLSALVATLLASAAFRRHRSVVHFGLIGLAMSLAMEQTMIKLYDFAGGSNGITNLSRPALDLWLITIPTETARGYLYLITFIVFAFLIGLIRLARSHFGLVLLAIRTDPIKAELLGYNTFVYRLTVINVSAAIGALAGGLYVPINGIAHPSLFGVMPNVLVLVWVAVGGQGSLLGPFLCAGVLKMVQFELGSQFEHLYILFVGLLLVAAVIFYPSGLAGVIASLNVRTCARKAIDDSTSP